MVQMKSAAEGGRSGPTPPGNFRTVIAHKAENFSGLVLLNESQTLAPGQTYSVEIVPLLQQVFARFMVGDEIGVWEGKIIATGKILDT
jgi:hypothetical protein